MAKVHQGLALTSWRHAKAWSQAVAADALGVAQAAWAAWETGRKTPDLENALALETLTDGAIPAARWSGKKRRRTGRKSATRKKAA